MTIDKIKELIEDKSTLGIAALKKDWALFDDLLEQASTYHLILAGTTIEEGKLIFMILKEYETAAPCPIKSKAVEQRLFRLLELTEKKERNLFLSQLSFTTENFQHLNYLLLLKYKFSHYSNQKLKTFFQGIPTAQIEIIWPFILECLTLFIIDDEFYIIEKLTKHQVLPRALITELWRKALEHEQFYIAEYLMRFIPTDLKKIDTTAYKNFLNYLKHFKKTPHLLELFPEKIEGLRKGVSHEEFCEKRDALRNDLSYVLFPEHIAVLDTNLLPKAIVSNIIWSYMDLPKKGSYIQSNGFSLPTHLAVEVPYFLNFTFDNYSILNAITQKYQLPCTQTLYKLLKELRELDSGENDFDHLNYEHMLQAVQQIFVPGGIFDKAIQEHKEIKLTKLSKNTLRGYYREPSEIPTFIKRKKLQAFEKFRSQLTSAYEGSKQSAPKSTILVSRTKNQFNSANSPLSLSAPCYNPFNSTPYPSPENLSPELAFYPGVSFYAPWMHTAATCLSLPSDPPQCTELPSHFSSLGYFPLPRSEMKQAAPCYFFSPVARSEDSKKRIPQEIEEELSRKKAKPLVPQLNPHTLFHTEEKKPLSTTLDFLAQEESSFASSLSLTDSAEFFNPGDILPVLLDPEDLNIEPVAEVEQEPSFHFLN